MSALWIRGGTVVDPNRGKTTKEDVWIKQGQIAPKDSSPTEIVNARGMYVAPGFVDLQVNGGMGHNFEDASSEEVKAIVGFHATHGTICLLPTIITAHIDKMRASIGHIRQANHKAIRGVHIEGPFISMARRGAHNPEHIMDPSLEKLRSLVEGNEDFIRLVTLAPELPDAARISKGIRDLGAIASLGHSDATYEEALFAIEDGISLFTHTFNAMSEFRHRDPGAVGAALASDVMVDVIADGVHVHPGALRLLFKAKGADRICLITDAMSAAGLGDGEYRLGGLRVFAADDATRLADGTLAGSTLTMDRAAKTYMAATGCSLTDAVKAASLNPVKLLGLENRKGSIEVGKDADIVIFDSDFIVQHTIIDGEVVYARHR